MPVRVETGEQGFAVTREAIKPSKIGAELLTCIKGDLPASTLRSKYGEPVSPLHVKDQRVN